MYSGKHIHHNESRDHIANLKQLSQKYDLANSSTDRQSRIKLPKIRSMTLQTSYKYLNKNNSTAQPQLAFANMVSPQSDPNYQQGIEKLNNGANFNSTIKEVTGEHFFTKYSQNDFRKNRVEEGGKESIQKYDIDDQAKCICFCQQRLGRQAQCQHANSEDVDEISKTILDQAKDFLSADKHTSEDILQIKEGLQKVEYVRSKNYLS